MKDRSRKQRSYEGELMRIGEPGEAYIRAYLELEYDRVVRVGKERRRHDYRCYMENGEVHFNEGKTDTMIASTRRIPWEVFRLENGGLRGYISWGYRSEAYRVVYFVPQWMKILDVRSTDVRRLIFDHLMAKGGELHLAHTLTDRDRITFFFAVPIRILREARCLTEVEIAELPLGGDVPYQMQLKEVQGAD